MHGTDHDAIFSTICTATSRYLTQARVFYYDIHS